MMGINRVTKRGKTRIEVRKRWPDGTTYRRYFQNMTLAKNVSAQIEAAITLGTWTELRDLLTGQSKPHSALTVREFADLFLNEYVKPRLRSWKRYRIALNALKETLGHVQLEAFQRQHLHAWVKRRNGQVQPATVNRDIAVIKKMLSYAWECGHIAQNPLIRFPLLQVREEARVFLTVGEFRRLVESIQEPTMAALVAVLGESGIRKQEALHLKWSQLDRRSLFLAVEHTKNGKVRYVPLSRFALDHIGRLTRRLDCPYLFQHAATGRRWINPEKSFKDAVTDAGFGWVGFHDLRRFRATQWVRQGIDVRTVKELLGHADIQTTMRYAQFVSSALEQVRKIQDLEAAEAETVGDIWETGS